jgi:hypothetical protein
MRTRKYAPGGMEPERGAVARFHEFPVGDAY